MRTRVAFVVLMAFVAAGCEPKQPQQPLAAGRPASGEAPAAPGAGKPDELVSGALKSLEKGLDFLFSCQKEDGSIVGADPGSEQAALGAAGLAAAGAARAPEDLRAKYEPKLQKACEYLLKKQMSDGSFQGKEGLPTYTTAIAVMALHHADAGKYLPAIRNGQEYLVKAQYYAEVSPEDLNYGGWTYGLDEKAKSQDANMSTTHYALMALKETGYSGNDEVFKRAAVFLQRSQNNSETNDAKGWKVLSDGGFIYGPGLTRASADKKGLVDENGKEYFPSYASMTYAGFKSLLYARLAKNDPRVGAALSWIKSNYTLDKNFGMGYRKGEEGVANQGLYYFYNAFAHAMDAWGEKEITDAGGTVHNWAAELARKLIEKQLGDGSWVNPEDRWHEGLKTIVTGYCVDALDTCVLWLNR